MNSRRIKGLSFILCFLFSFFFFGLGFRINYQPDIYGRVAATSSDLAKLINYDGRFINMLILFILHRGSFSFFYYTSLILSVLLISYTTYRYSQFLMEEINKKHMIENKSGYIVLSCLISCLTIANMFSAEFFLYIDMTVAFVIGIFLCVEATIMFVRLLSQGETRTWWAAFCMMLISAFIYEPILSLFVALTVPHIVVNSSSIKQFAKNQFCACLCFGGPLLIKSIYTLYVANSTRAGFDKAGFTESARQNAPRGVSPSVFVIDRITFGMWGYVFFAILVIAFITIYAIKYKHYFEIVKSMYIAIIICISGVYIYILRLSNDYKPRIYYPLGTFVGLMFTYGVMSGAFDLRRIFNGAGYIRLMGSILVFLGVQWISFEQMYVDCYVTNYEDKYISEMIGACIDEYEDSSGIVVDKVVFYDDAIRTKYSVGGWCLTQRAYSAWTELETLNMYLDRSYQKGDFDELLAEEFSARNWDCFSGDQVVIKGDTAHICRY